MNDAKPFGYEILDIKIGGVITRLKSTGYRIDNYLNGNVLRLEELEEKKTSLFYQRNGQAGELMESHHQWM